MEKQIKIKKSTKYLLIGVLVLFLSIIGASMAYYLARVSGSFGGNAAGTELAINVEKLSSNATGDLIPLDNDLETLNLAAAGYQDKGACVDINGYSVCQIYKITVTNNGSIDLKMNGTVTLSGQNTPNIDCATMRDATTVTNNNSCMNGMFVSSDTLNANSHNDYYVMVYINNLDELQTDSGEFNGTVTFTSEDGKKVKGRFTKPFNLVERITKLYNDDTKTEVENNSVKYNYATNVGLMNDRLGGTTSSLDSGNIRYYGAEPNNYIDIGDRGATITRGNWEDYYEKTGETSLQFSDTNDCKSGGLEWNDEIAEETGYTTLEGFCDTTTEKEVILWRIIGVFDGKLKIVRDEAIGNYSLDTSSLNSEGSEGGVNEWSQADLMKLLNPGFESNTDFDSDELTKITVNNSLYWNSKSGKCYNGSNYVNTDCDFTNSGLSDDAKEYVVDQTINLGGINFNTERDSYANQYYNLEKGSNVIQNPSDGIARTLSWTGKVGLIYPSDYGYATDFTECINTLYNYSRDECKKNDWLFTNYWQWTISPDSFRAYPVMGVRSNGAIYITRVGNSYGVRPVLTLSSEVLAETGAGSKSSPYVLTS